MTTGVDPYRIISQARSLVGLSGSGGISSQLDNYDFSWGEAPSYNFNGINIIPPAFQSKYGDQQPFLNLPELPVLAVSGSPIEPAFNAVRFVLNLDPFPVLIHPAYENPKNIGAVPQVNMSPPPTSYPVEGVLDVPDLPKFEVDLPSVSLSERLGILDKVIDAFDAIELEPFNGSLPTIILPDVTPLSPPEWKDYEGDEGIASLLETTMFDGALLSFQVQQAMFNELIENVIREAYTAEDSAFNDQAAKGFSLPSPALNAALLEINRATRLKYVEANRKVRDETAKRALDASSTAFDARLGLEAAHIRLFTSYVENVLKVQKINVRMADTLLRTAIDVFNKKVEMIKIVFRTYREYLSSLEKQNSVIDIQARLLDSLVDAYNAYVEMFSADVDVSQTAARIETLKVRLATLPIEAFSSQLNAVLANVSIARQNVEAFSTAVKAYSDATEMVLGEWDAYSAGVNAAVSELNVVEANYDAAAKYAAAETDRVESYSSILGTEVQGIDAGLTEYKEYSQAQRDFMSAATYELVANATAIDNYFNALRERSEYVSAWNRTEAERTGALNTVNLALADQNLRQQVLDASAKAAQARIDAGWLAAQAQAAASFAQSSLGIVSTNISLDGRANIAGGTNENNTISFEGRGVRVWGYSKKESVSK